MVSILVAGIALEATFISRPSGTYFNQFDKDGKKFWSQNFTERGNSFLEDILWKVDQDIWMPTRAESLGMFRAGSYVSRPQLVKGNMQLFSVDQQRSQALETHAASFEVV